MSVRLDITHLHKPAREQACTVAAVERHVPPRVEPKDSTRCEPINLLEQLVPTERAVRMVPAIQSAFASLSNQRQDGRGQEPPPRRRFRG